MLGQIISPSAHTATVARLVVTPVNPAGNSFIVYVGQGQPLDLGTAGIYDITPRQNISLRVRAWGASGGGGVTTSGGTTDNANGGGGGYAEGEFTFVANTTYRVVVGSPGMTGSGNNGGAAGAFGSPGAGSNGNGSSYPQGGGSGGGYTGLFSSTIINQSTALVIAGGGGGGGGVSPDASNTFWSGTAGGSATSVQNVINSLNGQILVTAPTSSAPGTNASGMSGANGGVGNYQGRGGGGGGYWGGGAFHGTSPNLGGIGGTGGISFVSSLLTNTFTAQGGLVTTANYTGGRTPGLSNEVFRRNSGQGVQYNTNGNPGRFILMAPSGSDPHFADVSLLLLMHGQNGSTSFIDDKGNTILRYTSGSGQLTISTAVWKFGGASALFSGGDTSHANQSLMYLNDGAAVQVGAGSFTIECWINPTTLATHSSTICSKYQGGSTPRWVWEITTSGQLRFADQNASGVNVFNLTSASGLITANNWHHVALVRNGAAMAMYINGVSVATGTYSGNLSYPGALFGIGQFINTDSGFRNSFRGYMDDFRLTKNVARYTTNFTPPTAEFPRF